MITIMEIQKAHERIIPFISLKCFILFVSLGVIISAETNGSKIELISPVGGILAGVSTSIFSPYLFSILYRTLGVVVTSEILNSLSNRS